MASSRSSSSFTAAHDSSADFFEDTPPTTSQRPPPSARFTAATTAASAASFAAAAAAESSSRQAGERGFVPAHLTARREALTESSSEEDESSTDSTKIVEESDDDSHPSGKDGGDFFKGDDDDFSPLIVSKRKAKKKVLLDSEDEGEEEDEGRIDDANEVESEDDDEDDDVEGSEDIDDSSPKLAAQRRQGKAILDSEEDEDLPKKGEKARYASSDLSDGSEEEESDETGDSEDEDDDRNDVIDLCDTSGDDDLDVLEEPLPPPIKAATQSNDGATGGVQVQGPKEDPIQFSLEEIRALEAEDARLNRAIESNQKLLRKGQLPDNGAKLRIYQEKLVKDRDATKATLEAAYKTAPNVFRTEKRLSLQRKSLGPLAKDETPTSSSSGEIMVTDAQKLDLLRKKKNTLMQQYSVMRPGALADGGLQLSKEINAVNLEIMSLEAKVQKAGLNLAGKPNVPADERKAAILLDSAPPQRTALQNAAWQEFRHGIGGSKTNAYANEHLWAQGPAEQALYGGRMTTDRRDEVITVTQAALKKIHQSLKNMPAEGDEEEDPKALRSSVTLFPHQRQALAWLLWRETQDPPGGILADDMGLGKTLTMLSLILKRRELTDRDGEKENKVSDEWMSKFGSKLIKSNTTLIICPASLIGQWENEAKRRLRSGTLKVLVYHGTNRKQSARELARYDLVITTYGTVMTELKDILGKSSGKEKLETLTAENDKEDSKDISDNAKSS